MLLTFGFIQESYKGDIGADLGCLFIFSMCLNSSKKKNKKGKKKGDVVHILKNYKTFDKF